MEVYALCRRWAIVTSCTRPLAEVRLCASGLLRPKVFVSSDGIKHGKPAPDAFLKGAEMLQLNPAETIVVEDVPAGVRSGKAAGCRVIALRTTMAEADLRSAGADWIVGDCSAIEVRRERVPGKKLNLILDLAKK